MCESGNREMGLLLMRIPRLKLCWRHIADRLGELSVVEPAHPVEGCELDMLDVSPSTSSSDEFGFEKANDRLGQGMVSASHRHCRRTTRSLPQGVFPCSGSTSTGPHHCRGGRAGCPQNEHTGLVRGHPALGHYTGCSRHASRRCHPRESIDDEGDTQSLTSG